ncbi:tRNA-dihydrouridine(20) synthase [NAD(P)+]-like isoform X2 [Limulus polyphemus]|uniref:tRNA-dihydrouridine(20) synthase [NAD(P)+]-like isoform X2 n=1 Tax=Limulus polyphemus TaxID=6850 RepID=A0ABM1SCV2_LIMPO|nr:tRNA-dihydrouridine(20) synthase [NAD(P)+]-like isoform X2 [Limulus polyphemus]
MEQVSLRLKFDNKIILAPMVRVGTLPMRLLALDFGADIVFTEELIDYRLLKCQRFTNKILGTIDYIDDDENIVFRTCSKERNKVVLQMGTCDPGRALVVAKMVEKDVAGIDVNMGCPKEFSIKGGMGAALLKQPDKVYNILSTLVRGVSCSVTCKMRVLPELEDTIALAKLIESTGVAALTVHGRTKEERPQHQNRTHVIQAVAAALSIPVIANGGSGEISCYSDIEKFRRATNASSVAIARQAEWNCSIFRPEGKLPLDEIILAYLKYAIDYDNNVINTKYCIQQMLGSLQETLRGKAFLNAQQVHEICELWGMKEYLQTKQKEFEDRAEKLRKLHARGNDDTLTLKRRKIGEDEVWELEARFISDLPKSLLLDWTRRNGCDLPRYITEQTEKSFKAVVSVNGKKYSSTHLEKNKKNAEQAAALVAVFHLGLVDENKIKGRPIGISLAADQVKITGDSAAPLDTVVCSCQHRNSDSEKNQKAFCLKSDHANSSDNICQSFTESNELYINKKATFVSKENTGKWKYGTFDPKLTKNDTSHLTEIQARALENSGETVKTYTECNHNLQR